MPPSLNPSLSPALTHPPPPPPPPYIGCLGNATITERKNIHFPGANIDSSAMPSLTEEDRRDIRAFLRLSIERQGARPECPIDAISLSHVRKPEDLLELRALVEEAAVEAGAEARELSAEADACDARGDAASGDEAWRRELRVLD